MIITRTPFRISFVGGGSDLKSFYSKFPGAVLSTTINQYMYISSHPFFNKEESVLKYSQTEKVSNLNQIKHPIFREVLKKFKLRAIEINSNADVPGGTGLGSSSSFTVGLLHNLYVKQGQHISKGQLAEEACSIEINKLKEPIGKQDQYAASFGGLNIIRFNSSRGVEVEPLHLLTKTYQDLQENLLMFYIGETTRRKASSILTEQNKNMSSEIKVETVRKMVDLVEELRKVLFKDRLNQFGEILHQNWLLKQKLAPKITNPHINILYNKALKNGAIGGKLLGAGGGGFLLFYCPKKKQSKLRKAMQPLREQVFQFETEGSRLIYSNEYE